MALRAKAAGAESTRASGLGISPVIHNRRRRLPWATVLSLGAYAVLSLVAYWPAWPGDPGRVVGCPCRDAGGAACGARDRGCWTPPGPVGRRRRLVRRGRRGQEMSSGTLCLLRFLTIARRQLVRARRGLDRPRESHSGGHGLIVCERYERE